MGRKEMTKLSIRFRLEKCRLLMGVGYLEIK